MEKDIIFETENYLVYKGADNKYICDNKQTGFKFESFDSQMCIDFAKNQDNVANQEIEIVKETEQYKIYKNEKGYFTYENKTTGFKLESPDLQMCIDYADQKNGELGVMLHEEENVVTDSESVIKH